jgi:hypothetical protein
MGVPRWLGCRRVVLTWSAFAVGSRHWASHGKWKRTKTEAALVIISAVRMGLSHLAIRGAKAIGAMCKE